MFRLRWFPACALLLLHTSAASAQDVLHLPIGDPARSTRDAPVVLDAITDTATGDLLTPAQLAARLAAVRIVFIGESHTDVQFHRAQWQLIDALQRSGRQVLIGLEMYPYTEQPSLDEWIDRPLADEEFVERSRWYKNWGYHWEYYRDLFRLARDGHMRMAAINTPREVVSAVRRKGLKNLTPEEAAHIPAEVDTRSDEHRRLFKAFFATSESAMHAPTLSDEQWDAMFSAQCTWDATMGWNAVRALERLGREKAIMVVLIGSGHVAYGLGIQRQAARWFDGRMASVIPIPIVDDKKKPTPTVRASYADFLWGLPPEEDPLFPPLGVSVTEAPGGIVRVIDVEKDSLAGAAGVKTGDVLVSLDGTPIKDKESLNAAMARKRWGDAAAIVVQRDGQPVAVAVPLRRKASS